MTPELEQIINYNSEGPNLDFKREEYPLGRNEKRNEILKDFSAFANHHSDSDKYIIVGIKEKNGIAEDVYEIEKLTDEATYQQFLADNIEPKINFEYKSAIFKEKRIAYFRIFDNKDRPYLFKKDLQNPIKNKAEHKLGDGFIKVGSSSRKLKRSDFESIYKTRFTEKDRKNDLKVEAYFETTDNTEIPNWDIKYLDIGISNQSNRSIEFDVEMKVFKNNNYHLISESDFIEDFRKKRDQNMIHLMRDFTSFPPLQINLQVDIKEQEDFVIISRNVLLGKTAIRLAQNSSEQNIFNKQLFVLGDNFNEIKAELTIRSDDFTEGSLIRELTFRK